MRQTAGFGATTNGSRQRHSFPKKSSAFLATSLLTVIAGVFNVAVHAQALGSVVVGSVRVQCLSDSLVRLEVQGPLGFEDRQTFHVVNRNWPGTPCTTNLSLGEVRVTTANYVVHVPTGATSLSGVSVTAPASPTIYYQGGNALSNSVWLPGPSDFPRGVVFCGHAPAHSTGVGTHPRAERCAKCGYQRLGHEQRRGGCLRVCSGRELQAIADRFFEAHRPGGDGAAVCPGCF